MITKVIYGKIEIYWKERYIMLMVDLILKKRTGQVLTDQEINFIINEYVKSNIPDYQMSAFLMAVCFKE